MSVEEAIKVNFMDLRNQIHESLGGIEYALCMPKCADWHQRTCGECGWANRYHGQVTGKQYFDCRRTGWQDHGDCYLADQQACPAFVERPEEDES